MKKLFIISGRSGSGKSTALRALEDSGFNCIDNFPIRLLKSFVDEAQSEQIYAVGIDARSNDLDALPVILAELDRSGIELEVIYLDALTGTLVKRFSETRRRHPLTNARMDLLQAIEAESDVLRPIADVADLTMDTTTMRSSELVEDIRLRIAEHSAPGISVLFRSFGFKFGVPVDADLVFDLRCLPNPHWEDELKNLSGLDEPVKAYLDGYDSVTELFDDIAAFLGRWVPRFEESNRAYITVALGCTGGQHRSVYMAEKLGAHFKKKFGDVLVRHRQLG
jgi:UPF0042 nucleotide-binding protein